MSALGECSCQVQHKEIERRSMITFSIKFNKTHLPFFLVAFFLLCLSTSADAKYDIARRDFETTNFVGPSILDEAKLRQWNYAPHGELEELLNHQKTNLLSTKVDLSYLTAHETNQSKKIQPFLVPDILYPVVYEVNAEGKTVPSEAKNSMGLNLVPIGSGEPVYRVDGPNNVREKFQEHLIDPNTGRPYGRVVDEETFDRVVEEIVEDRRQNAPKLSISDFDGDGSEENPGIAELVRKQLSEESSTYHEWINKAIMKATRDAISEIPAPSLFDEKWFDDEWKDILKASGLKNTLTQQEARDFFTRQKTNLRENFGQDQFDERIYDKLSEAYQEKIRDVQQGGDELDAQKLSTWVRSWCQDEFRRREDEGTCRGYGAYLEWDLFNQFPRHYAENTLKYAYSGAIARKRFDEDGFWEKVWQHKELVAENNPDSIGVQVVDRLVRQSLFPDAKIDDKRHMYAIVGHNSAHEAIYKQLRKLTSVKVQTSIHHVSAYYGANGYTRRGFLEGGEPNNLYTVVVKGVDQEAFNLNAKIWAKIYYENPEDHYQFSEDYEFDEMENTTLRRIVDFARGWLDKEWINKPLNAKYLSYAEQMGLNLSAAAKAERKKMPYYQWLQEDPVFGLYCFEGVTNQLNVALNVPLTEKYLKRLYGEEAGAKLFDLANKRWLLVLKNEGIPEEVLPSYDLRSLASVLNKMKPLWELKGMLTNPAQFTADNPLAPDLDEQGKVIGYEANPLRDVEYNKVGNSLAWIPQTTGDIVADLIEIYVPFHKTKALVSASVILGFQREHERRTGISKETYMGYALPIISEMFKAEVSLVLTALTDQAQVQVAKANYLAEVEHGLKNTLKQPNEDGEAPSDAEVARKVALLMEGIPAKNLPGIKAGVAVATGLTQADIVAGRGDPRYAAWLKFKDKARAVLAIANKTPVEITDPILARMQEKKFVKFYTRPGLLQAIVAGSWPTNPHVLLRGVGTVIDQKWTKQKDEAIQLAQYNYLESEAFVKGLAKESEEFRRSEVDELALKRYQASLYDAKVIGIEDGTSNDAERRVRRQAANLNR